MTDQITRGRCLCGAIAFEYEGPALWSGYCHCDSCRRNTASPVAAFVGAPRAASRITGAEPQIYESSPGVRRLFCGRCGSPIAYEADKLPEEIHFYAANMERPENCRPEFHVHAAERLPWFEIADELPRHPGSYTTIATTEVEPGEE